MLTFLFWLCCTRRYILRLGTVLVWLAAFSLVLPRSALHDAFILVSMMVLFLGLAIPLIVKSYLDIRYK